MEAEAGLSDSTAKGISNKEHDMCQGGDREKALRDIKAKTTHN